MLATNQNSMKRWKAVLALIVATAVAFWRISRLAAVLLVPYALWVGFASLLTWSVWQANPKLL